MVANVHEPQILFEDNHLLVVAKPPGMLTQGDRSGDTALTDWSRVYLRRRDNKPGAAFVALVHRLDRPTSGVVVLACTSKAARRVSGAFRERRVEKQYLAVTEQPLPACAGRLHGWMRPGRGRSPSRMVAGPIRRARQVELDYERLGGDGVWHWYRVTPLTGRKHQIRTQLSDAGAPIVGDRRYGAQQVWSGPLLLHAWSLTLPHPIGNQPQQWHAPLPAGWPVPPDELRELARISLP